jgi:hypothetical protein
MDHDQNSIEKVMKQLPKNTCYVYCVLLSVGLLFASSASVEGLFTLVGVTRYLARICKVLILLEVPCWLRAFRLGAYSS